jgi:hypothetical protein
VNDLGVRVVFKARLSLLAQLVNLLGYGDDHPRYGLDRAALGAGDHWGGPELREASSGARTDRAESFGETDS